MILSRAVFDRAREIAGCTRDVSYANASEDRVQYDCSEGRLDVELVVAFRNEILLAYRMSVVYSLLQGQQGVIHTDAWNDRDC